MPVLQGWEPGDYLECAGAMGELPSLVGVGSESWDCPRDRHGRHRLYSKVTPPDVARPTQDGRATESWPACRGFEASSRSGTVANLHALPRRRRPQRHSPRELAPQRRRAQHRQRLSGPDRQRRPRRPRRPQRPFPRELSPQRRPWRRLPSLEPRRACRRRSSN